MCCHRRSTEGTLTTNQVTNFSRIQNKYIWRNSCGSNDGICLLKGIKTLWKKGENFGYLHSIVKTQNIATAKLLSP